MKQFAVFGNPIKHSKSPRIHKMFSEQTGIALSYNAHLTSTDNFDKSIKSFFSCGGSGANITIPFKEQAYKLVDELSERASLAGAVNTIKVLRDGRLLGDNTDGIGLLSDIKRLGMVFPKTKILLIGAGGAARGIIQPLLSLGCELIITNRTYTRAQELSKIFSALGKKITSVDFSKLQDERFDLIINATSSGIYNEIPQIPFEIINKNTACYDIFYQERLTPFLSLAKTQGVIQLADGLGMLVEQAAYSFLLWNEVMPATSSVLEVMRKECTQFT
ncbi:shikimate dehydrogenase [Candidatus Profftia tarda]|nr:shikimate dehydrogenase [Candidatus Profftia tarda]